MFTNFKFLLSMVFLLSLILPVFSFEPSGGVLVLDGEDDYAILPLAEHGYIFPAETDEFTVEVWFYPKSEPKPKERHLILGQQAVIGLSAEDECELNQNQLCAYGFAYLVGKGVRAFIGIEMSQLRGINGTIWQLFSKRVHFFWHTMTKLVAQAELTE